jgi:lysozyme
VSLDLDALRRQLIRHEGFRRWPYRDTVGKLTIGVGRNLDDVGLSDGEIRVLLDTDIGYRLRVLPRIFPWFAAQDDVRQRVLIDLSFMGVATLLGFTRMLAAWAVGDYATAAAELLDSRYARQVGSRAVTLAAMLRTGAEVELV